MFNLSGSEIVVILLLALVVLGPDKLPDFLRRAGRTYAELKRMGNSFQSEMKSVLDEPMQEMKETADLLRTSAQFEDHDASKPGSGGRARPTTTPPPLARQEPPAPAAPSSDEALINETLSGGAVAQTSATSTHREEALDSDRPATT